MVPTILPEGRVIAPNREAATIEYKRALEWLYSFATYEHKTHDAYETSKLNLERMRAILARLGNPQEKFRSVHIAGTKGKGSTAALCESILRAAGFKTGLYTSPHLHTFRERIRVGMELIPREAAVAGVARLREIEKDFPSVIVFELMTALAFDFFARAGVEIAVVEVGLGGRLDATNVITPLVSVITSISFDHMHVLGNTLAQIAREKAGIIKPGIPAVSSPQAEEAREVIEQVAQEKGAVLIAVKPTLEFEIRNSKPLHRPQGQVFVIRPVEQSLDFQTLEQSVFASEAKQSPIGTEIASSQSPLLATLAPHASAGVTLTTYQLHLLGPHQLENATTAIAAMHALVERGVPISPQALSDGVDRARWAGRFEILERAPYVIVDGAHNRDSARQLVATLDALLPGAQVQWIFGASWDKDIAGMFAELQKRSCTMILTRSVHPRAADPHELAKLAEEYACAPSVTESVQDALALARSRLNGYDAIVATGSLFVVAEARELILRSHGEMVESDE